MKTLTAEEIDGIDSVCGHACCDDVRMVSMQAKRVPALEAEMARYLKAEEAAREVVDASMDLLKEWRASDAESPRDSDARLLHALNAYLRALEATTT